MAYTAKTWADGDTITADALNNIEQGIASIPAGAAGASVASIAFTTTDGKITGGTAKDTAGNDIPVTVTEATS